MIEVVKFKSSSYNQYLEEIGEDVECLSDEEDDKVDNIYKRISKFFVYLSNAQKNHKIFHLLSNSAIFKKTFIIIISVYSFLHFENIIKIVSFIFLLISLITETIYKFLEYQSKEIVKNSTKLIDMISKKGKFETICELLDGKVQGMQMMLTKSFNPEVFSSNLRLQRNLHYLEFMAKSQAIARVSGYYIWIRFIFDTILIIRDLENLLLKINLELIEKSNRQESLNRTLNIQRFILDDIKILKQNQEINQELFQRLNYNLMMVDSMLDDKPLKTLHILKEDNSSKNDLIEEIIENCESINTRPDEPEDVVFIIEGQGQKDLIKTEDDISFPSQFNKTFQANLLAELKLKIQKELK